MFKKQEAPQGAPEWVVTYGDCMSLLLCFFIVLFSMSEIKENDRFMQVRESILQAFRGAEEQSSVTLFDNPPANTLVAKLLELERALKDKERGQSDQEAIVGDRLKVTNVRDGLQIVVGGQIAFSRFSAVLHPESEAIIRQAAELIKGYTTKIIIKGHATREPMPADAPYADARSLSFARAEAVAQALEAQGVERPRMILVAVGDTEPLVQQAYEESRLALNRRVEILVTENLVEDYAGAKWFEAQKEVTNAGR